MKISAIVAKAQNNTIGKDNQLIWRLPNDLKYFKQLTLHHHVLMGRKTYESIGKPLPQRTSIVLSRNWDLSKITEKESNLLIANQIEKGIALAKQGQETELFVIGGAEIYKLAMPFLDCLYVTEVQAAIDGDAFFPLIGAEWQEKSREKHLKDEKHLYDYDFVVYER
jgi:dihydrofolate reductase